MKKVPKDERRQRVAEALEMVRLPDLGERKPAQLSGGQRQRVALARAIVNRPQVLLLDEPLGALDLKLRQEMQIELKRIQQDVGITFVYVTHDQEEALTMSDRIAVFNHGRIEQIGPPAEVYEHPASEFIAGFVGVSNVIERDGRRYTVRPEKIHVLAGGQAPEAGSHVEDGSRARRPVRRADHPVPRHPRPRRGAPGAGAEPGGVVGRGAGEQGTAGAAASGARSRSRKSSNGRDERMAMSERKRRLGLRAGLLTVVAALAVAAAGCGGDDERAAGDWQIEGLGSTLEEIQANAKEEGEVNIVQWPQYATLVDEFTAATGCKVNLKDAGTGDDMISLIQSGEYDGVSASGHTSVRLMAAGDVAPVNPDLLPNYADITDDIKLKSYNSKDGEPFGAPHGRGPNLLTFRTDEVTPAPDSWSVDLGREHARTRARSRSTTTRSSSPTPPCT